MGGSVAILEPTTGSATAITSSTLVSMHGMESLAHGGDLGGCDRIEVIIKKLKRWRMEAKPDRKRRPASGGDSC